MRYRHRVGWSCAVVVLLAIGVCGDMLRAQSVFTERPDDPGAVFLTADQFRVKGDGVADDADGIQQAVDRGRGGIVFVPEGRYRLGKTVYVPTGTRVIGYGKSRPVFVLGANTPGFQEPGRGWPFGTGRYMIHFAERRLADGTVVDASEFSFNCAVSNIDFEVGEGNPSAVCVRFHVAQHSYLSHMNFKVGSGLAALEDVGNQASNVHITGGKYGILSTRTSAAWQFLLMDSVLENQSVAGIRTQDVGFSLVRCKFGHVPVAIEIPEGQTDQIYGRDLRFEDISRAGMKLGDVKNVKHQVTLENTACADVPEFVAGGEKIGAPGKFYVVDHLSAGLEIGPDGREVGIVTRHKEHALSTAAPVVPSDIPSLPPMSEWFNVRSLGQNPDLQAAINEHRVLYFPMGTYRDSKPLTLKQDTVLIGLHCTRTTVSAIASPKGGSPFVSGLGFSSAAGAPNILWNSGEKSVMDDIAFGGGGFGRGASRGGGGEAQPYLLVSDGGGGIIRNLWLQGGAPPTGLRGENTSTPTKVYQLSNEHHSRVEVALRNVRNWEFHCLQTEEESAQQDAYALDIEGCRDILFANTDMYRVSRIVKPVTYAVKARDSDNIVFDNVHIFSQTRLPYDNAVLEEGSGVAVRANNFTHLVVGKSMKRGDSLPLPAVFGTGTQLEKLASGFGNATSLTADGAGRIYFTDAANRRIYRWNDGEKKAEALAETSGNLQPQVMGYVKPSTLLIAAFAPGARQVGGVFSLDVSGGELRKVEEVGTPRPGTALLLPVGLHNRLEVMEDYLQHRGYVYRQGSNTAVISVVEDEHRGYFYAPGSDVALMAGGTGRPITQSSQLAVVEPGRSVYLTSEDDCRTWAVSIDKDFKLTAKLFADRGGNSVVADADGNVYIAGGNVEIYDRAGIHLGTLETPERATSLVFGGPDRKTLFIGARSSVYAIATNATGE